MWSSVSFELDCSFFHVSCFQLLTSIADCLFCRSCPVVAVAVAVVVAVDEEAVVAAAAAVVVDVVVVDVVVRDMRQVWGQQKCDACLVLKAPMQNAAVLQ